MSVSVSYVPVSYHPAAAMAAQSLAGLPFFASDELIVWHEAAETGVRTVLIEDADYAIGGLAAGGALSTAATITALAEWPADDLFHVERRVELRQEAAWQPFEQPPATDLQRTLDRAVLGAQESRETVGRALAVPVGESINPLPVEQLRNGGILGFATIDGAPGQPYIAELLTLQQELGTTIYDDGAWSAGGTLADDGAWG
jgi:hypothetical protein